MLSAMQLAIWALMIYKVMSSAVAVFTLYDSYNCNQSPSSDITELIVSLDYPACYRLPLNVYSMTFQYRTGDLPGQDLVLSRSAGCDTPQDEWVIILEDAPVGRCYSNSGAYIFYQARYNDELFRRSSNNGSIVARAPQPLSVGTYKRIQWAFAGVIYKALNFGTTTALNAPVLSKELLGSVVKAIGDPNQYSGQRTGSIEIKNEFGGVVFHWYARNANDFTAEVLSAIVESMIEGMGNSRPTDMWAFVSKGLWAPLFGMDKDISLGIFGKRL